MTDDRDLQPIYVNDSNMLRFLRIAATLPGYTDNDVMEMFLDCFEKHEVAPSRVRGLKRETREGRLSGGAAMRTIYRGPP
jgi:hypothetical protein